LTPWTYGLAATGSDLVIRYLGGLSYQMYWVYRFQLRLPTSSWAPPMYITLVSVSAATALRLNPPCSLHALAAVCSFSPFGEPARAPCGILFLFFGCSPPRCVAAPLGSCWLSFSFYCPLQPCSSRLVVCPLALRWRSPQGRREEGGGDNTLGAGLPN
jgi:hypothetical protein